MLILQALFTVCNYHEAARVKQRNVVTRQIFQSKKHNVQESQLYKFDNSKNDRLDNIHVHTNFFKIYTLHIQHKRFAT